MADKNRNNGETTEGRNADGTFAPGNPGRPHGARHKATVAVLSLMEGQGEALAQKAVELALGGDTTALRLCIERIAPTRKDVPVAFGLPEMENSDDAAVAAGAVLNAVANGDLTPIEAASVMALIETFRRTLETTELERRVAELERGRQ